MKQALIIIGIFAGLSFLAWKLPAPYAGNTFPATGNVGIGTLTPTQPLQVVGTILKTDPTYTGTFQISHTANNQVTFYSGGISNFMVVGPSNTVDFVGQQVSSLTRGAILSAPSGGTTGVYEAIKTVAGNAWLGSTSGRTIIGTTADNGVDLLQVYGTARVNAFKMPTGANSGYVMTSDGSGVGSWQPATGGSTSAEYIPTLSNIANCTSMILEKASYFVIGNIVHVKISGQYNPIAGGGTRSKLGFTVPFTAASSLNYFVGTGTGLDNGGQTILPGWVQMNSSTVAYFAVNQVTAGGTTLFVCEFQYVKQ